MTKNKGKGGKNRRRGKNDPDGKGQLQTKDEDQDYGQVTRMLGNGRLEATCFADGKNRQCHIRGKMRKKMWVNTGDIVLISLREFQTDKADVILKYSSEEARKLKKQGELPECAKINETDAGMEGDEDIDFEFDTGDVGEQPEFSNPVPYATSEAEESAEDLKMSEID